MVFVTTGKSGLALALGNSDPNRPQYMAIGTGSETIDIANVDLITETDRRAATNTDITTIQKVSYIFDWNSVDMSGTTLTEFGIFTELAADAGSLWNKEGFAGIEFDGTNELQIQQTFEVF